MRLPFTVDAFTAIVLTSSASILLSYNCQGVNGAPTYKDATAVRRVLFSDEGLGRSRFLGINGNRVNLDFGFDDSEDGYQVQVEAAKELSRDGESEDGGVPVDEPPPVDEDEDSGDDSDSDSGADGDDDGNDGDEEINPGWFDPKLQGGRMLDIVSPKFGEPLNVIISSHSDPYVLTEEGLRAYSKSIGFSEECLGLHFGNVHRANLGDGNGPTKEAYLAREYFNNLAWGTCWQSITGGNHFRAWKQDGPLAPSGAWFLAVSKEESSVKWHKIVKDGYNIGRDLLVERALASSTNGSTQHGGKWWKAGVEWNESDLLMPGAKGINHNITQDGRVAILTITSLPPPPDFVPVSDDSRDSASLFPPLYFMLLSRFTTFTLFTTTRNVIGDIGFYCIHGTVSFLLGFFVRV